MKIIRYYYKEQSLSFYFDAGHEMIQASEMGCIFGKKVETFLNFPAIKDYVKALKSQAKDTSASGQIIQVHEEKIWMHRKLALRFAQWLDPYFALWLEDRIDELRKEKNKLPTKEPSRKELAWLVIASEEALEKALEEKKQVEDTLEELKPKALVYDQLISSETLLDLNQASKLLNGYGRNRLCKKLRELRIFFKDTQPYQQYIDAGYFKVKEFHYRDKNGKQHLNTQSYVTQKGINFLIKKLNIS